MSETTIPAACNWAIGPFYSPRQRAEAIPSATVPKVSFIIPAFNEGSTIAELIGTRRRTAVRETARDRGPTDVPQLIEPLERVVADVVFGSRLRGGRPQRAYLFWHLVGNRVPQSARERALQHHPVRHRDRVQKRFARRSSPPSTFARTASRSSQRSRRRYARGSSASMSCRSPTTAGRTPRERRSPGETASARRGCSCASCSRRSAVQLPGLDSNQQPSG
jgi:hypothetical protein